jgi:hypothetical protein
MLVIAPVTIFSSRVATGAAMLAPSSVTVVVDFTSTLALAARRR